MVLFRRDVSWKCRKFQLIALLDRVDAKMKKGFLNERNFSRGMLYVLALEEVMNKLLCLLYRGNEKELGMFIEDTPQTNPNMFSELDLGEILTALNSLVSFYLGFDQE